MDKDILEVTNQIGEIFKGTTVCGDCPVAHCRTSTVARCRGTIYSKQAGCCSEFAHSRAYLRRPDKMNEIAYHKKFEELCKQFGWDWVWGFFDNDKKACKLPRYYRSRTCQVYTCGYLDNNIHELGNKSKRLW